ncbi:MAG: ligase-associated DNA damage response DEXH box helicase [Planctomyces sp.]
MSPDRSAETPQLPSSATTALQSVCNWFNDRHWTVFPFQMQAWQHYLAGHSGLIHATTGTGKTLAAWLGPVAEALAETEQRPTATGNDALRVLWITPLRALAVDTLHALQEPLKALSLSWSVESRTGDTSAATRRKQQNRLPTTLVTTPESLSLLLTRSDAREQFRNLRAVICDEWHELLATKRGVQVELALARLRRWRPALRTWALSATLGNLPEALAVIAPPQTRLPAAPAVMIQGASRKQIVVDSLIPERIERFPWAGHMGLNQLPDVLAAVDQAASTLIFTNTRSQTEAWYHAMLQARPDWAGLIALHHGSLDPATRNWVEDGLRAGQLRAVVCTSSLDLGVDFSPVDRVLQIGSPRGVARLLQRAGRSGHRPGAVSRVTCVPTHAFELIEAAAARDAIAAGQLEGRQPHHAPVDVLCQHLVTIASGSGFDSADLFAEVRTTASYNQLTREEWDWALDFTARGGESLRAYPDYHRLREFEGLWFVGSERIARQHRMSIGTITSDASLTVQYLGGPTLGTIEESFLAKINPGETFLFAGRTVELVHIRDMKVWVRKAPASKQVRIPRWMGGRMPLSTELAHAVRLRLDQAAQGIFDGPELTAVRPLLELQARWSEIPRPAELLIEQIRSREGFHTLIYPFAGRLVHEGLSALFAWRMSRLQPITFTMSVNDYGFELLSATEPELDRALQQGLLSTDALMDELQQCINAAEMGKRQFREIARVAGLVFQGFPGQPRSARQLQASSGLLYDVFASYDPQNLLLRQAGSEVLERQLEHSRLVRTLQHMQQMQLVRRQPQRFTPLAFPLIVARLREKLSSEKLSDRIARMTMQLESAADR